VKTKLRDLKDRVAVVTGAGNGIGHAIALELARNGMHVVAADFDADAAKRTAGEVVRLGRRSHAVAADVRKAADIERVLSESLSALGGCHVAVNNAGVFHAAALLDTPAEQWQRVVDTNLWGVINGSRIFGAYFAQQGLGHIVNTASAAGLFPTPGMSAYSTTKFAVVGLSLQLRWELSLHGVGVTLLCPGVVRTGIATAQGVGMTTATAHEMTRRSPLPEGLAVKVAAAIRKNKAMVRYGPDAYLFSLFRLLPLWLIDPIGRFAAKTAMKVLQAPTAPPAP
jgi:NAD(P)-dependent dehydrogenase (short-subunit alcohol dehydrogenase family)